MQSCKLYRGAHSFCLGILNANDDDDDDDLDYVTIGLVPDRVSHKPR